MIDMTSHLRLTSSGRLLLLTNWKSLNKRNVKRNGVLHRSYLSI
nr:MAG TPA: hypothetical protein [Caudoviricetes sp.]